MSIWFKNDINLEKLNQFSINTMNELLGIRITELGENYIKATMPVDKRTHQAYGILHGGASAALAETLGSIGSVIIVDPEQYICVGVEINANHIRRETVLLRERLFRYILALPLMCGKSRSWIRMINLFA